MTFLSGLLIGGVVGAILGANLGVILMAILIAGGQADQCSECMARLQIK